MTTRPARADAPPGRRFRFDVPDRMTIRAERNEGRVPWDSIAPHCARLTTWHDPFRHASVIEGELRPDADPQILEPLQRLIDEHSHERRPAVHTDRGRSAG